MSSDLAISVRGLGKSYKIEHKQEHTSIAETLLSRISAPFRKNAVEEIWAMRDVSFDIPRGDIVGLLGRNGAGKSTLLKLLSRITAPTTGEARITGRIAVGLCHVQHLGFARLVRHLLAQQRDP